MLGWIKKKQLQSKCPHEWHKVKRDGKVSFATEEFYYISTIYCPLCDKNKKMREDKANQIMKQQDIKRDYSNDFRI